MDLNEHFEHVILAIGINAKQPFFHQIDGDIGVGHGTVDGVFNLINQARHRQLFGETYPVHHHSGEVADGVEKLGVVTARGGSAHQQIRRATEQAQGRGNPGVDHVEQ
ncbi:hypothetical protein D3C78_1309350 [compost metagenome]